VTAEKIAPPSVPEVRPFSMRLLPLRLRAEPSTQTAPPPEAPAVLRAKVVPLTVAVELFVSATPPPPSDASELMNREFVTVNVSSEAPRPPPVPGTLAAAWTSQSAKTTLLNETVERLLAGVPIAETPLRP
jgi:hypothetical protein